MRVVEVLSEVLHFRERELTDRGITVEAETSDDLPLIMGDRNQLKQVFFQHHEERDGGDGARRASAHQDARG